ncbi:hypothetical protein [Leifsonia soli]|uniref:Helicase n=1 Tax=Leifsonia soli TaxID=582665 RepID=A0A852T5V4_9MICO|nr:hypothetical protein [Leifsonia soli]NYD75860.1 hypothetical protein [Leifsonia soli]
MQRSHAREADTLPLRVGGRTRAELRRALASANVRINAHAETLLDHPTFDAREPDLVTVVTRTVIELGFSAGATLPELLAAAPDHGLALCPPDTGPYFRLAMTSQANAPDSILSAGRSPAGAVIVASAPLSPDVEFPKGFYLRVVDDESWLRGYRCDDEYRHSPGDRFAFQQLP